MSMKVILEIVDILDSIVAMPYIMNAYLYQLFLCYLRFFIHMKDHAWGLSAIFGTMSISVLLL